ncbi:MAG: DUF1565 domain-containing protein, partial [Clostridia bacterium]|nr:DUF1565 domain-containing protein [Clostridia bacterium]
GTTWSVYNAPVVVTTNNTTVYARAKDAVGNISEASTITITNIDKIPPSNPVVSVNPTTRVPTVTVTINYSVDSVVKKYSIDGGSWLDYTGSFTVTKNCTISAKAQDAVTNWSEVVNYSVTNVGSPPTAVITMSPTTTITDNTYITWSSSQSTDPDSDQIVESEWQLDSNAVSTTNPSGKIASIGGHTMKLRVKDSTGMWSEWVSKVFAVSKDMNLASYSRIIYADINYGNDTYGDGSEGNPYKTLTKAHTISTSGANQAIFLKHGTYTMLTITKTVDILANPSTVTISGTEFIYGTDAISSKVYNINFSGQGISFNKSSVNVDLYYCVFNLTGRVAGGRCAFTANSGVINTNAKFYGCNFPTTVSSSFYSYGTGSSYATLYGCTYVSAPTSNAYSGRVPWTVTY